MLHSHGRSNALEKKKKKNHTQVINNEKIVSKDVDKF
jgi:hypothetical protein